MQTAKDWGRQLEVGDQLVEVPTQSALDASPLGHEVVSVIDEQAKLPGFSVQACHGQPRLSQCGSSYRECVDGIGFSLFTAAPSGARH